MKFIQTTKAAVCLSISFLFLCHLQGQVLPLATRGLPSLAIGAKDSIILKGNNIYV
ncbi:MAG: hypothetical protein JWM68_3563, partial [Verrucomicrobiales bacterium]|nr:hypothetical protein [Verrucomicrobiales bacterium]